MVRLHYLWVWLRRFRHSRGFGVQSPSAYQFIRYVVNEHWPYYQYEELGKEDGWLTRKLGRLYFRMVNWYQPQYIFNIGEDSERYAAYLHAGSKKAEVMTSCDGISWEEIAHQYGVESVASKCVFLVSLTAVYADFIEKMLNSVGEKTVVILEGIHHDKAAYASWQSFMRHKRVSVCYDLYYCGILFFDKKRYKKTYIVNF